jgi:hypothetical protein
MREHWLEQYMTREYVIDGSQITSLEAFYAEIGRVLVPATNGEEI